MHRKKLSIYALMGCIALAVGACRSDASRIECLNRAVEIMLRDEDSRQLLSAFQDTMRAWKAVGVRQAVYYHKSLVKVDAVLMDSARRRGIIIVLTIDTSEAAVFDHVDIYGAEKKAPGVMHFYASLPTLAVYKPSGISSLAEEFLVVSREWKPAASDDDYFDCDNLTMREEFFDELLDPRLGLVHERFKSTAY